MRQLASCLTYTLLCLFLGQALLASAQIPSAQNTLDSTRRSQSKGPTVTATQAETVKIRTLEIAVHPWAPWAGAELTSLGIAPRLTSEILTQEGTQLHYNFMHWSKALEKLSDKKVDAAIIWVSNDMALDQFLVSEPLVQPRAALYYRNDKPFKAELHQLKNIRMAWQKDYVYNNKTYKQLTNHVITGIPVKDEAGGLNAVLTQKADVFLAPFDSSKHAWKKLPDTDIKRLGYKLQEEYFPALCLVINADQSDSKAFMQKFNKDMKRLHQDGRYARITETGR
jgi:ABC-type amino acid transport substrate-binding protein